MATARKRKRTQTRRQRPPIFQQVNLRLTATGTDLNAVIDISLSPVEAVKALREAADTVETYFVPPAKRVPPAAPAPTARKLRAVR